MTSQPIPAAAPNPPPAALDSESSSDAAKRIRVNNERLIVLANTLMNDDMMEQYGIILDSTKAGGYKNGSEKFFTSLATFLNGLESSKKHSCIAGVTLTGTGLKAWMTCIKKLASEEKQRQEVASAAGREIPPAFPHISASFALMEKASLFLAARQKQPNNRYTAKPKGLEHLELQKTDDPSIAEYAGGGAGASGQDMQDAAAAIVRDTKRAKRALHEEGMAGTAGKEKFTNTDLHYMFP